MELDNQSLVFVKHFFYFLLSKLAVFLGCKGLYIMLDIEQSRVLTQQFKPARRIDP